MKSDEEVRVSYDFSQALTFFIDDIGGGANSVCQGLRNVHHRNDHQGLLQRREAGTQDSVAKGHRHGHCQDGNLRFFDRHNPQERVALARGHRDFHSVPDRVAGKKLGSSHAGSAPDDPYDGAGPAIERGARRERAEEAEEEERVEVRQTHRKMPVLMYSFSARAK